MIECDEIVIECSKIVIECKIFYHDFTIEIVMESTKIIERLFLVKNVKTSFYHDFDDTRKGTLLSRAKRVIEGPLSVNHQMSGRKTLLFLQDVFFFNFRDFQNTPNFG